MALPRAQDTDALIELVSVNVGLPSTIGHRRGKPILSGIVKRPVSRSALNLDRLNLEGDRQADLRVHGGPDKAVYAYPSEHLPTWNRELGTDFGIGTFGENLSTRGLTEHDVRIGDIWAWGDALMQVAQPRSPCYKLALVTGRPDLLKRFIVTGRTGWYLRVLRPGAVPTAGPILLVEQSPLDLTVWHAHAAMTPGGVQPEVLKALATLDALASGWRRRIGELLERSI